MIAATIEVASSIPGPKCAQPQMTDSKVYLNSLKPEYQPLDTVK